MGPSPLAQQPSICAAASTPGLSLSAQAWVWRLGLIRNGRGFQGEMTSLENGPDLGFVAFHQSASSKASLSHLAQFGKIFPQHLDLRCRKRRNRRDEASGYLRTGAHGCGGRIS